MGTCLSESESNGTGIKIIVELPDNLVGEADKLGINVDKTVEEYVKVLRGIFP